MASKSKKRRRVLGASCILAALIIAGSSFAWFTSKDEVTNRLQASSDYGVSIVESFTPPKNMLPGQEVNKDVYAVNTGNIAAFVKEDVKGKLNYTFEKKVNAWDADCLELTLDQAAAIAGTTTQDGYKTDEAGGFLAWTDAVTTAATKTYKVGDDAADVTAETLTDIENTADGNDKKTFKAKVVVATGTNNGTYYVLEDADNQTLYTVDTATNKFTETLLKLSKTTTDAVPAITPGPVYSGRTQDITTPWTPTANGTYIFRRSVGGTADEPIYKYAGYYYKDGKYYKIVIGNDTYRVASTDTSTTPTSYVFDMAVSQDALGIDVNNIDKTDGSFTEAPDIYFVKDEEVKDQDVTLKLGTNDDGKPCLVVEHAADAPTVTDGGKTYDASADAARKEIDYYNKLGASNRATVAYEQMKADHDYAAALTSARDTLKAAAVTRKSKYDALNDTSSGKKAKYDTELSDLKSAAGTAVSTYNTSIKDEYNTKYLVNEIFTAATISRINSTTANPVLTQAQQNLKKMVDLAQDISDIDGQLATEMLKLVNASEGMTPTEVQTVVDNVKTLLDSMKAKATAYSNAFSAIVDDGTTATALELGTDSSDVKSGIAGLITAIENLKDDMDSDVSAYKTAYDEWQAAKTADDNAQAAWEKAIDTYNASVAKAEDDYKAVVTKTAPDIQSDPDNNDTKLNYADHASTIVPFYSANRASESETNPRLDKATSKLQSGDLGFDKIAQWNIPSTTPAPAIKNDADTAFAYAGLQSTMNDAITATNNAKKAYDTAKNALNNSTKIKFYVNLDENYADNWTMQENTNNTQDVVFYLNSILDAGETSVKLIDSITFDKNVSANAYKNLTFDLNVGLDSAQITYDNDQRTIKADAVSTWNYQPTLADAQSIDTDVTWAAPTP